MQGPHRETSTSSPYRTEAPHFSTHTCLAEYKILVMVLDAKNDCAGECHHQFELPIRLYRVIQDELPPLTELISDDILSKMCHINLGHILNIYRVTFVFGFPSKFQF
jgi:hypothetical protein